MGFLSLSDSLLLRPSEIASSSPGGSSTRFRTLRSNRPTRHFWTTTSCNGSGYRRCSSAHSSPRRFHLNQSCFITPAAATAASYPRSFSSPDIFGSKRGSFLALKMFDSFHQRLSVICFLSIFISSCFMGIPGARFYFDSAGFVTAIRPCSATPKAVR